MLQQLSPLLRGASGDLASWLHTPERARIKLCLLTILLGFGVYGLTVGLWRSPLMGVFVSFKMPGLIFLTILCNGLLNGMLGAVLGSGLGFRQSLAAQLLSFSIAAVVLASLTPVTYFLTTNAPSSGDINASTTHTYFLIGHTFLIAFAGILANLHLAKILIATVPNRRVAALTLISWLLGNAFVGAQLSWILRPFYGTPSIEVAFLRDHPFDGTFYEVVWRSLEQIFQGYQIPVLLIAMTILFWLHTPVIRLFTLQKNNQQSAKP